jgi:hypothetical protein
VGRLVGCREERQTDLDSFPHFAPFLLSKQKSWIQRFAGREWGAVVGRECSRSWIDHSCSVLSSQHFEWKSQWVAQEPASKQKEQGIRKLEREREGWGRREGS